MVSIISSLKSIRFRLILVVILVVSALLFQILFLVSTQDSQTNFKNEGDAYLEFDTLILSQLDDLNQLNDQIEAEHVSTILGDLLFTEEVNVTLGQDTFKEFEEQLSSIRENLEERQDSKYFIATEINNPLVEATGIFQNPSFNQSIVDDSVTGINNLVNEFNSSLTVEKEVIEPSDLTGIIYYSGVIAEVHLLEEASGLMESTRKAHNNGITGVRGSFENTTGFVSIVSARIDAALASLTNDSDADELNRKLHMLELFRQISEYVSFVGRFEKLNLGNENVDQATVEQNIEALRIEIDSRSVNITNLTTQIRNENTVNPNVAGSIGAVNFAFGQTHRLIGNALNFSSINLGKIIEDTRDMIQIVSQDLTEEQNDFQIAFGNLLNDLDNDLRNQTQTVSAVIIIIISLLVVSTTFILVRYFNKYERNYRLIGEGKLNIPPAKSYSDNEIGRVNSGFDNMMIELKRVLAALQRSSERMAGIAEELAAGSEEASASVQEVSNTVRDFSAGAAEQNLMLNRVDDKLSEHLKSIEDATSQINATSNFVLKVAKRTNILGLNASIEAAKAGRFGLGFNVVAEEVRNLSTDTRTSALEIADLIDVIETKIQTTIREIQQEVNITKDVAENTAAGSEEANAATSEQVVMLHEISQTSNELSLLANELQELLNRFDL